MFVPLEAEGMKGHQVEVWEKQGMEIRMNSSWCPGELRFSEALALSYHVSLTKLKCSFDSLGPE